MLAAPAAIALAIGAGDAVDEARARLQSMSPQQRAELADTLNQFELQATSEQQKSIREIDRKLSALAPEDQAQYLAAMRRYHNWLDSLPETVRDTLQAKPPGERMAQIKTLVARYPVPMETTPYWMQFADVTAASPFELATVFRIWQELRPEQRREVETQATAAQRRLKLMEHGRELKLLRELKPPDFIFEDWVPKVEAKLSELQAFDPEIRSALNKAENAFKQKNETKPKLAHGPSPLMRRLAINLYYLEQPPPRPVDPQRLAQFFAAMPPWVRTHLDTYPADEARRRLTLVYRLLYPKDEFKPTPAGPAARPGSTSGKGSSFPSPPNPALPRKESAVPKPPQPAGSSPF